MSVKLLTSLPFRGQSLVGQSFGKLTIVSLAGLAIKGNGSPYPYWNCVCVCGKQKLASGGNLKSGHVASCGCFQMESRIRHGYGRVGRDRHPIYQSWDAMIQRCTNPKCASYKNYGGRGIAICKQWKDFSGFLSDMGHTWKPSMMIERLDNDGHYEKSNCVWATRKQQNMNKRNSIRLSFNGKALPLLEWVKETGLSYNVLIGRIKYNWPVKNILTLPLYARGRLK